VNCSNRKVSFGFNKSLKAKEFEDGSSALAWEKLNKKYNPQFTYLRSKPLRYIDFVENGKKETVTLLELVYEQELGLNLFCIRNTLKKSFNLGKDGDRFTVRNGNMIILFDRLYQRMVLCLPS
jgi:hypothetical protein